MEHLFYFAFHLSLFLVETQIQNNNLQLLSHAIMCLPGQCMTTPIHHLPSNKMLANALQELPSAFTYVLIEKFLKEKSVKEIATENGYSVSTAKLYFDKGMHRLRMRFNEEYRNIIQDKTISKFF